GESPEANYQRCLPRFDTLLPPLRPAYFDSRLKPRWARYPPGAHSCGQRLHGDPPLISPAAPWSAPAPARSSGEGSARVNHPRASSLRRREFCPLPHSSAKSERYPGPAHGMSSHQQGWTGCSDDPVIISLWEFSMIAVVGIDVAKHTFDIATL